MKTWGRPSNESPLLSVTILIWRNSHTLSPSLFPCDVTPSCFQSPTRSDLWLVTIFGSIAVFGSCKHSSILHGKNSYIPIDFFFTNPACSVGFAATVFCVVNAYVYFLSFRLIKSSEHAVCVAQTLTTSLKLSILWWTRFQMVTRKMIISLLWLHDFGTFKPAWLACLQNSWPSCLSEWPKYDRITNGPHLNGVNPNRPVAYPNTQSHCKRPKAWVPESWAIDPALSFYFFFFCATCFF